MLTLVSSHINYINEIWGSWEEGLHKYNIYIYVYAYIYICIHRGKERERERASIMKGGGVPGRGRVLQSS